MCIRKILIYLYPGIQPFWFSPSRYRVQVAISWWIFCFPVLHFLVLLFTTKKFREDKSSWLNIQAKSNWILISNILKSNSYSTVTVSETGQVKMQKALENCAECLCAIPGERPSGLFKAPFLPLSFHPIWLEKIDFKEICRSLLMSMPVLCFPLSSAFHWALWVSQQPILLQSEDKSLCLSVQVHLS